MQDVRSISSQEPCQALEVTQLAAGSLQSLNDSVSQTQYFLTQTLLFNCQKSSHNPLVSMHATRMWKLVDKLMLRILIFW